MLDVSTDHHTNSQACEVLLAAHPDIYQRAGSLCKVGRTDSGRASIYRYTQPEIHGLVDHLAEFIQVGQKGQRSVHAPKDVSGYLFGQSTFPNVRPLLGISTIPVLHSDGSIHRSHGYDPVARIYCDPTLDVRVPDDPTLEDARCAVESLSSLLSDFPFAYPAHATSWLACLLTVAFRHLVDGPVPVWLFNATRPGSGKSLLGTMVCQLVSGQTPATTTLSEEEETKKRLLAYAIEGRPVVFFDNLKRAISSESLEGAITSGRISGRLLGVSSTVELPWSAVCMFSANGGALSRDMARRSLVCTIQPDTAHPELRTGFALPLTTGYCSLAQVRSQALSDAMTLMRAYHLHGSADTSVHMASFGHWAQTILQPLVWAGCPNPLVGISEQLVIDAGEDTDDMVALFFEAWRLRRHGARKLRCIRGPHRSRYRRYGPPASVRVRQYTTQHSDIRIRRPGTR